MCPNSYQYLEFDAIRDLPERRFLDGADTRPVERVICTRIGDTMQANVRVECERPPPNGSPWRSGST